MRRILLTASCSLIALSAIAASPAIADPLKLTIGGDTQFRAGFADVDDARAKDREFKTDSNISVSADGKSDNGLSFGARVAVDADEMSIDKQYVYGSGFFGRIEAGDVDGAASRMTVAAPSVGLGQAAGVDPNSHLDSYMQFGGVHPNGMHLGGYALNSDTATKLSFFTPIVSGFQGMSRPMLQMGGRC